MIKKEEFFNDANTVNVFTDASVKDHGQVTESVAGIAVIVNNANPITAYTRLIPSTNNEGEIYAIYMGILECISIKNTHPDINFTFNIFSDSRICVFGLREWYKGWINNTMQTRSSSLISSSGEEVKNQQIFIRCFNAILSGNIRINIYHVRGHIDIKKEASVKAFAKDFKESNHLNDYPSIELIKILVDMNNMVDTSTRSLLLPLGKNEKIPTIMGTHKKSNMKSFHGINIKSEYLFDHHMLKITTEKRRYAQLVNHRTKFKES